jgi:polysaccharide export outer membrane protein
LQGSALNAQGEPIFAAGQASPSSSLYTDDNITHTDRPTLQGSLALSRTLVHAPKNLREQLQALAGNPAPYRLGLGDVLEVRIQQTAAIADIVEEGPLNSDGVLDLADLGAYRLQGLSLEHAQRVLQAALAAEPLQHPLVLVRVSQYRSQFVRLQGEIYAPGDYAIDATPMSLAEAITRAGGLLEKADLGAITLQRNGQAQPIDLRQLYQWGLSPDEILLRHGDILTFSPSP